jgi:hypothetical protein
MSKATHDNKDGRQEKCFQGEGEGEGIQDCFAIWRVMEEK